MKKTDRNRSSGGPAEALKTKAEGLGMRAKLIIIFLIVKVLPIILLTVIAWRQLDALGTDLREIAVSDSSEALNDSAVENIERMTTDTAMKVAEFLYERDDEILYAAEMERSEEAFRKFIDTKLRSVVLDNKWELAPNGKRWVPLPDTDSDIRDRVSTNSENDDMDGFNYRRPDGFKYESIPVYDEITFIDINGNEQIKAVSELSPKIRYPLDPKKKNVALRENTYVMAEDYFSELKALKPGEIYVSDVIGAYVGSNFVGMYAPEVIANAEKERGYDIEYAPKEQAYAGAENPDGIRFEGIVRWATPVTDESGSIIGYVTLALNHDHIMEFVDHLTPMGERYRETPSAAEGNYAFIWDYKCRSICHPRHHSIVGFNPETGDPEIPWLEQSTYDAWQKSGIRKWTDFVKDLPVFNEQSREKSPAKELTKAGLVGLDGRYLDNAPQCTGWMDLTEDGGSGSFYILWSELYKLTTAAAIPYYTGHYAPSEENNFSRRGFGFVAIGAGLEDFTRPAKDTEQKLNDAIERNSGDIFRQLLVTTALLIAIVVFVAIWIATSLTDNITELIHGIFRFRSGERQFRFNTELKDEFGTLADSFDDMADNIVYSVNGPLCITDMNETVIYMNEVALKYNQRTLQDVVGSPYSDSSIYPADSKYNPIKAFLEGHEADVYELLDGSHVKGSANYFYGKDGEKIGYIITTTDVTEMVHEQMEIEKQRTLLNEIFSSSPDLIWYMDSKNTYLKVNPRFASIAGRPEEDFIGKGSDEIMPPEIVDSFKKNNLDAAKSKHPVYTVEKVKFADGHEETLDSVRTPLFDANGEFIAMLGFARDVSARVTIENELRSTQLELEQAVITANKANEHKGNFLARMSHEIRTPMNAVIGLTNIVQKKLGEASDEKRELTEVSDHVRQIEISSQHLLGLLNDILDISKIDSGKIELSEEPMELFKLANQVAGIIRPRCAEKNITFETNFDSFEPSSFIGDSLRLRQVLINLLGNAVKFTGELGTISFSIKRKDKKDEQSLIEFSIKDSGIGISKEMLETIFLPFEQANDKISKKYGGTGLGLAISKRIVNMLGGEISAESTVGKGSEFSFCIWLKEEKSYLPNEEIIADATDKFIGKRALLVDDVEINRMIVMTLLEDTGMDIDEAEDGEEAVSMFKAAPENTYNIVLMDIQMPNMDGYEATEAIRALDRADAQTVPIIALTANAFKEDMDKALAHGMSAHLAKPIEPENLNEMLFRFLAGD